MGKLAKVFLLLLLLSSSSSYSQEIKVVRSLGFDGKNVLMAPRGNTSTTASTGCLVLHLHPNSLAYQLGIEKEGFVVVRYGHQNLETGCEDIDEINKSWKDDGRLGELQVTNRDGRIGNGIVTTAQFRLAQQNLNSAKGSQAPSPTDLAVSMAQHSGASQSNSAIAATGVNSECNKQSYFVLKPGRSAKDFKFSKDGSIYFKNKIIYKYEEYSDVATELHISQPSAVHGYYYVVLWDTDTGGLGGVIIDGKEGQVIARFTRDMRNFFQVIGEEICWSPNESYAIVPERGEGQRHVNVIDLKRGNIFPLDIGNLVQNECQFQFIDNGNGSWLNDETYRFRVGISLNPWWEEMTKGLKCNENEHYPEYEVEVNARTRQVSSGTLKSKISSTKSQSSARGGSIAATGANSPPTLTIFVDGISLYSSINSMVGRELFIGPDVDRASNYLKGSPLANIFSDGEVKEILWNGDISDNVNVKKAVNDLEFILLKSSHECGKKINVVAHSMGTVISYLALLDLKFKTKEHNGCTYHGIDNLITLASPLVRWPSVVNRKLSELGYPSSELKIRPPGDLHIQRWINAYAQGDNVGGSIDVAGINNLPEIKTVVRSITANSTPSTAIGSIKAHSLPYTDQDTITRISNLLSNSNTTQTEPQLSERQSAIDTTTAPVNALRLVGLEGVDVTDKKGVTACKVVQSYPGTPAANAGIKADDIIVRFDGKSLNGCNDLKRIISATQTGKIVPVEVIDLQKRTREIIQVVMPQYQKEKSDNSSIGQDKIISSHKFDYNGTWTADNVWIKITPTASPDKFNVLLQFEDGESEYEGTLSNGRIWCKGERSFWIDPINDKSIKGYMGWNYFRRIISIPQNTQPLDAIVVNEHQLNGNQEKWVRFVGSNVTQTLLGTRADKVRVAARASWWALKEGMFSLSAPISYSSCSKLQTNGHYKDVRLNPLELCESGKAWQVGVSGVQVPNFSEEEVLSLVESLWPGRNISDVLTEVIKLAGNVAKNDSLQILASKGVLRKSWLLRHPSVGMTLVEKNVTAECIEGRKAWCYGGSWAESVNFAATRDAALKSISDLENTFNKMTGIDNAQKDNLPQPNKLITSQSVGPVQIGMSVAQVRKALPNMKLVVSMDGDGADFVEVKNGGIAVMLMYPISDQARPINDRTKIEYVLVCDGSYATKDGVHPGMFLRDVESAYGKLTKITMSEIESREEAEFARIPTGITLRVGGASHSQAGIYPQGKRQTTQFYPDASVHCIGNDIFSRQVSLKSNGN